MASNRETILYVDDEAQALKYFKLAFQDRYEVLTAPGPAEGWALVEQHGDDLALIISDQRMPGGSGAELLTRVRENYPGTMRLLTTAYSELEAAVQAVNQGAIYAYVHKPWKIDDLKVTINRALAYRSLQLERDELVREKLGVVQNLLLVDNLRGHAAVSRLLRHRLRGTGQAFADCWQATGALRRRIRQDGSSGAYWQLLIEDTRAWLTHADCAASLMGPTSAGLPDGLQGDQAALDLALGLIGRLDQEAIASREADGFRWRLSLDAGRPGLQHALLLLWLTVHDHGGTLALQDGEPTVVDIVLPARRSESVRDETDQAWILQALLDNEP